ncbi:MAG: sulfurtransferase [Opitutaceae bacterium]|nr:sulfurtransferase [Opitutaceae bacterium]|tara:strand:- start:909 stop:1310 length:402 start_codon:yes stop_codon:yes gene_type:complete
MKFVLIALAVIVVFIVANRVLAGNFMSPSEAAQRVADGAAVLIDVREPSEWASSGVAAPAVLLSLSDLHSERVTWKAFLEKNKNKELILYCRSGNRSGVAVSILAEEGFQVANAGGFKHWKSAGQPVRSVDQD